MSLNRSLKHFKSHPLSKKSLGAVLLRYAYFNLYTRISGNSFKFYWINDLVVKMHLGDAGFVGNYYLGLSDFEEMSFLLHYLKSDDLFLDIGSNLGAYSLLASTIPGVSIHAIEADQNVLYRFIELCRLNNISEINFSNVLLGHADQEVYFSTNKGAMNHVSSSRKGLKIQETPLDSLQLSPELIKVDVEGYEMHVIRGGTKTFENANALIIELNELSNRYGFSPNEIHECLNNFGFRSYKYDPFKRELSEIVGFNTEQFNTIYLKNKSQATERVCSGKSFQVYGNTI